jgi:peptidoglycan hydrolase-like protein with peptidoglycan-binding domain
MSRLRVSAIVGSAIAATGAVLVAAVGFGGDGADPVPQSTGPRVGTVPITRATLTQTQRVTGTLGYGSSVRVTAHQDGTITWLPALGTVIRRDQTMYQVDSRPVALFYGTHPFYRPLRVGDTGADVKEVEQNLAALGYTGPTVDTKYTSATAAAVGRWQRDHSLARNAAFNPATVVLAPAAVRVASVDVQPGDLAGGRVLTFTGTTRTVQVPLDVALQSLVRKGTAATVTLPNGKTVTGAVRTLGTVAVAGAQPDDPATIPVTIAVADQSALGTLDQAPVTVTLVSATVRNVLTVPVTALVALGDGGTAVDVVTGPTSHHVPVRLGMFGNGRVQISGTGIAEGVAVVVPS